MNIMTRISCDVTKCMYNTDGGCKLHKIEVGTLSARMTDETLCESFVPSNHSVSNSCGCRNDACDISEIKCSAENCKYNDDGECEAKKIEISPCRTGNCGETECKTFKVE
ncbi:MAG: DUF1540 domain-containing protein [Ruminococcaceae bacterium]|nr:DUF1540 domain-containing protein [Oscillospiraceae bacterium]